MNTDRSYNKLDRRLVDLVLGFGVSEEELSALTESDTLTDYDSIVRYLADVKGIDRQTINRKCCIISHNPIFWASKYDQLEEDAATERFWGDESVLYRLFKTLDLSKVVELACGRGRHVSHYIDYAGEITLVDAVEENIIYCARRIGNREKVRYYYNNGYDLSVLKDDTYTSIFSYDSMVHFELFDIFGYLKETYRILKKGGLGLFHHSNCEDEFKNTYFTSHNRDSRSYMTKSLFAYLTYQAGLEVVEQHVIDWNEPESDCVTLVRKPL